MEKVYVPWLKRLLEWTAFALDQTNLAMEHVFQVALTWMFKNILNEIRDWSELILNCFIEKLWGVRAVKQLMKVMLGYFYLPGIK